MKCPNCKTVSLSELSQGGVRAHVCAECHGLWFKKSEVESLKDSIADHGWYDVSLWEKKELLRGTSSALLCPECDAPLCQIDWNHGELVSDICSSCGGMWLPKGEYEKAARYIKEDADADVMEHYPALLSSELTKLLSHEKGIGTEAHNLASLLRFFSYRFITKHPVLTEFIEELPFST